VVVHVENASVARRTVVASFGLENMADQTVPPLLVLRVVQEKALAYNSTQYRGTFPGSFRIDVMKDQKNKMKVIKATVKYI